MNDFSISYPLSFRNADHFRAIHLSRVPSIPFICPAPMLCGTYHPIKLIDPGYLEISYFTKPIYREQEEREKDLLSAKRNRCLNPLFGISTPLPKDFMLRVHPKWDALG